MHIIWYNKTNNDIIRSELDIKYIKLYKQSQYKIYLKKLLHLCDLHLHSYLTILRLFKDYIQNFIFSLPTSGHNIYAKSLKGHLNIKISILYIEPPEDCQKVVCQIGNLHETCSCRKAAILSIIFLIIFTYVLSIIVSTLAHKYNIT